MNFKTWLIKLFGTLGKILSVLFKDGLRKELEVVVPIAAKAVRMVANDLSVLKSPEKRNAAVAAVLAELAAAQIEVGLSIVNLAIELAYVEFKNSDEKEVSGK